MTFADMALMRSLPNFLVFDAVDDIQLRAALPQLLSYNGNVYIRMPRKSRPQVFEEGYKFNLNKADKIFDGSKATIIACGVMAYEAKQAAIELQQEDIDVDLLCVNTIRPFDSQSIVESAKKTNLVITCENHNIHGGLYSNVCETLSSEHPTKVIGIGINDQFGQVGKYDELIKEYKLTKEDIKNTIRRELMN